MAQGWLPQQPLLPLPLPHLECSGLSQRRGVSECGRPLVPAELPVPSRRPAQLAGRGRPNEARRRFSGRFDRAARHLRRGLGAQEAPRDAAAALRSRLPACLGRLPRRPPRCRTQQRPLRSLLDPVGIQPTTARLLHFSPSSRVESRTRTSSFSTCNLTTYSIPLSDMRDSHLARPSLPPHSNATWCRRR